MSHPAVNLCPSEGSGEQLGVTLVGFGRLGGASFVLLPWRYRSPKQKLLWTAAELTGLKGNGKMQGL
jgi:hypothetical protein